MAGCDEIIRGGLWEEEGEREEEYRRRREQTQKRRKKETEERMNVRRSRREAGAPRRGPRSDLAKSSQALAPKARRAVLDLARSAERGEGARKF